MNLHQEGLVIAASKGYSMNRSGRLFRKDKAVKGQLKRGYLFFTVSYSDGVKRKIALHRFQAYLKFGEAVFGPDMVVRHLDGNKTNNSWDNIAIGTPLDNSRDNPIGFNRRSPKWRNLKNGHTEEFILLLKEEYASGVKYPALMRKYGVNSSFLSYHISSTAKDRRRSSLSEVRDSLSYEI